MEHMGILQDGCKDVWVVPSFTQFLWVPGTHELKKTCVLLYFCALNTHTCALMGTLTGYDISSSGTM